MKNKHLTSPMILIVVLFFNACNRDYRVEKEYYYSDNLKSITKYKDGLKNGDFEVYYLNGNIKEKGQYFKDTLDGIYETYYKDGNIKSFEYITMGKNIGAKAFYSDIYGISYYLFYDKDSKKRYICKYDSNQTIVEESGKAIPLIRISAFKVKIDSEFIFTPIIAGPLYYDRTLYISENGIITDSVELADTNSYYTFSRHFNEIGIKNICAKLKLHNSSDTISHYHQTCIKIEVIE